MRKTRSKYKNYRIIRGKSTWHKMSPEYRKMTKSLAPTGRALRKLGNSMGKVAESLKPLGVEIAILNNFINKSVDKVTSPR